jgi:NADH dehydrogenase FAD-containing subunit
VEVAGEFEYFLREASRVYPNFDRADYSVTLIEIADRILPPLDRVLAEFARCHMERRGILTRRQLSTLSVQAAVWVRT